ncbi:hypothetical protein FM996_16675 [Methylosinus sporium]|uniref:Uncharacterized protein n=1 Tax=Methylosinus sporium TaxID=428 RepID=A0A549SLA9_METSR|nr:hypothetical protein [Methylosinus sporium]TRL30406.1 hypothetical protein FM996_16675 [Methylosinus sporium]
MMDEAISTDEKRIIFETPHIHIDLHVHLDGPLGAPVSADRRAPVAAPTGGTRRSLLTTLVVAFGVSAVAFLGFRAGSVSSEQKSLGASRVASPSDAASSAAPLPDALARDLQRPPQITPAPGTPADAGRSGPAAFGLQQ